MIFVVISVRDSMIYGPFSSYKAADIWRDMYEKKHPNEGPYIKRVINPASLEV